MAMGNTLAAFSTPTPGVCYSANNLVCISKFPALGYKCTTLQPLPPVTVAPTGTQYKFTRKICKKWEFSERVTADRVAQYTWTDQICQAKIYLATHTVANIYSPKVMSSKIYFISLVSLASLTIFAGKHFAQQDTLAYNKCMQSNNNYSYCKVLVWGRWVTNNNPRKVNYTLWGYFCTQNVVVHLYCTKNLDNLLRLILVFNSDVESRNLQRQLLRCGFAYYAAHIT